MSSSARVATDRFFLYNEGFQIFIPNGWVELMAFCLSFKLSDSTVDVDLIDPASSLLSSGSTNSSVTLGVGPLSRSSSNLICSSASVKSLASLDSMVAISSGDLSGVPAIERWPEDVLPLRFDNARKASLYPSK